jgi:hypothetical protein
LWTGFDGTGLETGIIKQNYPALLGTPTNDSVSIRADDMRDPRYLAERARVSGAKQASNLNSSIAQAIRTQGAQYYRSNTTSGYTFIATAQAILNERQQNKGAKRYFMLNDRDQLAFANDLAGRQTLQGQPAKTWENGQIGNNIAEFDIYTGAFCPTLAGGASPATTVTGTQSFAPISGSVDPSTGVVTNSDYRFATIPVAASASYNVGDKVTMGVNALGQDDKTDTGQLMTFTITAKPSGTSITVTPRPIAADDPALNIAEKAYANINTRIVGAAVVARVNTDASGKTNLFWTQNSVEVMGGTIPANLFKEFGGLKSVNHKMKNGQTMTLLYDADMTTLQVKWRLFTWSGITVAKPTECGVAIRF